MTIPHSSLTYFYFIFSVFSLLSCLVAGQINLPLHPQYHVTPNNNWMNDPNGPMYYNGLYHLFYQYNPDAPYWGEMHWGHAVSKDLVHWQNLVPALYPDQVYDKGGVFSGSVTFQDGKPIIIYTGIGPVPSQCIAYPSDLSDPFLTNWTKSPSNPVIPSSPPSLSLDGYRDPTTAWQIGSTYYMLVGAGESNIQGMTLLYQTDDFLNWTYVHPFYNSTNISVSGDMWECPDFYPLGEQHVMKASTVPNLDMWFVGTYNSDQTFTPFNQGVYDYGRMYASKTFNDTLKNRRILWGWTAEMDSQDSANARGWAGMQSLPRELTLTADYKVAANPIDELTLLRTNLYPFGVISLNNSGYQLEGIKTADQFELLIKVQNVDPSVSKFGVYVLQSPDHQEQTAIYFLNYVAPTQVDMPGSDYRGVSIPSADPLICQSLCFEDFLCRAWTFTPAGMEGPTPMCFLKNFPANTNPKEGCVSGRKAVVAIDRSNSSLSSDSDKGTTTAPMGSEPTTLRIFVDHSVIEIFANDGTSNIISRVYPSLSSSIGVSLFVEGEGNVDLEVSAWDMGSIWN